MNIYYVYAYLRSSDNTPYYIGKGKGTRAYDSYHKVSVPKDKSKIVFLEMNLTNVGACALERRYIRWYGRKINNTGILRNITEGGEGNTGPRSEEWKSNHSKKIKGTKLTEEHIESIRHMDRSYMQTESYRKKMSNAKKGTPLAGQKTRDLYGYKIACPQGVFSSANEASKKLGISRPTITNWAKNKKNGFSIVADF